MERNLRKAILLAVGVVCAASGSVMAQQAAGMVHTESFYPTGQRATSILLIERMAPVEARAGTAFEYQVKLTNLTDAAMGPITVIETFPEGFSAEAVQPEPRTSNARTAEWLLDSLAGGSSVTMRIRGTAASPGELTGCVTLKFDTESCLTHRIVQPALRLEKSLPTPVSFCDIIPMRLVITNTGTGTARGVRIEDTLPDGLTVAATGDRTLSFDVGNMAEGSSRDFTAELRATRTGSFTNRATATGEGGLTAEATAETLVRKPELVVKKSGPEMRYIGRPATFQISVTNTGDEPARETVLVDAMPADVQVLNASDDGRIDSGRVTWNLGTLEPNASREVSVTLTASRIGIIENTASASAVCADGQAMARIEFRGIPAILLEVVDERDPVEVGNEEIYVITVTNQGSAIDTDIVIGCMIPDEQEYVRAEGPTEVKVEGRTVTFAPLPSLAPKAKAVYRVITKGLKVGDTRFSVKMTSDQLTSPVTETESTHVY